MSTLDYFYNKAAEEGKVSIQDVRDLLVSLEFNNDEKKILDVKTGQVRGRFYVITKVKYKYREYEVKITVVAVDRMGITHAIGEIIVNDVDDTTNVVVWETED